ncbi:transcriptional regulatory protein PtsJ [Klebsiella michiganensis]|uniref:Transcriptional regulatory protein PtsJ n=1 Tax=Klebsiella michiganensis TaxID=1134687 RepID=A0A7H4MUC3_9ENTR|nr:transcriptional regulatory protein PtsJ [Klebsiella michiganensis]
MRLAIVASDADTSAALRLRLNSGSQWVSHLLQDLVIACLNDNTFMASLAETRRHYRQQHEKLIAALASRGITHLTPGDGLNFWFRWKSRASRSAPSGARRLAGSRRRNVRHSRPFARLRLSLATLSDNEMNKLANDLYQILQQQ